MYKIEWRETNEYTHRGDILINGVKVGHGLERNCTPLINELLEDPEYPRKLVCVLDIFLDILQEKGEVCRLSL